MKPAKQLKSQLSVYTMVSVMAILVTLLKSIPVIIPSVMVSVISFNLPGPYTPKALARDDRIITMMMGVLYGLQFFRRVAMAFLKSFT